MSEEGLPLLPGYVRERTIEQRQRCQKACRYILVAQACERLAFYTLSATLVGFLIDQSQFWSRSKATLVMSVFSGAAYATSLFGGWISDSYVERFWTIFIGYLLYITGYVIIIILIIVFKYCDGSYSDELSQAGAYTSLSLVALGAGMIHTNLATFGGEQVRELRCNGIRGFFTSYYWAINCGALLSYAGVVLLVQWKGFLIGYVVACASVLVGFVIFTAGKSSYITGPAENSDIFGIIVKIICNAYKVKKNNPSLKLATFMDYAHVQNPGGKFNVMQIRDVRLLRKVLVTFLLMIPFWICYGQMYNNIFQIQGLHMRVEFISTNDSICENHNHRRGDCCADANLTHMFSSYDKIQQKEFTVPAVTLTVFNNIFILAFLPGLLRLYRCLASHGICVYTWRRLLVGITLAVLALLATGILETLRQKDLNDCGCKPQKIDNVWHNSAPDVLIWWQIPQYCLLGASEIFFSVTALEYTYTEAPRNMQGILMGLYYFIKGVGFFLGLPLPLLFKGDNARDSSDINCNNFDKMLYALAAFLFAYAFVFRIVVYYFDLGLSRIIIDEADSDQVEDRHTTGTLHRFMNGQRNGDTDASSDQ